MSSIDNNANMTTSANAELIREKQYNYSGAFVSHGGLAGETVEQSTEAIRQKQYEYSGAFISHGGLAGETVEQNTETIRQKQYEYSGATVSHGETIEEVPEFIPKKKYMWTSVVDFFKQQQKFGRRPFMFTPNI